MVYPVRYQSHRLSGPPIIWHKRNWEVCAFIIFLKSFSLYLGEYTASSKGATSYWDMRAPKYIRQLLSAKEYVPFTNIVRKLENNMEKEISPLHFFNTTPFFKLCLSHGKKRIYTNRLWREIWNINFPKICRMLFALVNRRKSKTESQLMVKRAPGQYCIVISKC